ELIDLGTLGGDRSAASDINDSGQVVGNAQHADGSTSAFLYSDGHMIDLGSFDLLVSYATAINASGQVAGTANTRFTVEVDGKEREFEALRAVLYSGGGLINLGTLGGDPRFAFSDASDINDARQVAGTWGPGDGTTSHAFLYSQGAMSDLGTLGGDFSGALGINAAGQVVGQSTTSDRNAHAFLYSDGVMTDLGGLYSAARGIN